VPGQPVHYQQGPQLIVSSTRTSGLAVASLVLGIIWLYWVGSVLAIVFGVVAMSQIKNSQGTMTGRGMAIAGLVLGLVGAAMLLLVVLALLLGAGGAAMFGTAGQHLAAP